MRTRARILLPALLVLAFALAACGDGGDSDDEGIATLDDSGTGTDDTGGTDEEANGGGQGGRGEMSEEFEDALLEYAECMRDQGIDFPDPSTDGDGMVVMGPDPGEGPPSRAEIEEFEAADEECRHIMEEVQDEMPRPDPEQEAEMRDEALAFAECMREHGIDFPDPQFEEGGGIGIRLDGIDPEDPDFQEAQEECSGELGGIFSTGGRIDRGGDDEGDEG
jgi:hypothetical protein